MMDRGFIRKGLASAAVLLAISLTPAMAAEDDKPETLQEATVELTEISQRIRRGHRGAA